MGPEMNAIEAYDRVLLIGKADLGNLSQKSDFDPLHPVFLQTEGADPFTYRNDFCTMRLTDESVQVTRSGSIPKFQAEWEHLLEEVESCRTVRDIRIYDFDFTRPPVAVVLTTYGRVRLFGEYDEFNNAAQWVGIDRIYWDAEGFGGVDENDTFRGVGCLRTLNETPETEKVVCSALPGHLSPIAFLLQKNGTVILYDRKNHTQQKARERVQNILLVRYNPYGLSTWVALSKITGRFLSSEPRDSISADFFGGDYTDVISPNRYRQKIKAIAGVPRRYLAVLYENGYLRAFGAGFHSGDILAEDVRSIELEGEELVAMIPSDLSYAPAIEMEETEEDVLRNVECLVELGKPVELEKAMALLADRIHNWQQDKILHPVPPKKKVRKIFRNHHYIYFLYEDGTAEASLLASTGHSNFGENRVEGWTNVKTIVPGTHQTLGLTTDGRVLVAGCGYGEPYRMKSFQNVTAVAQSSGMAVCLLVDGTVRALMADTNLELPGVSRWHHVTKVVPGDDFAAGLSEDGTVWFSGSENMAGEIFKWKNITDIAATGDALLGLCSDGTVVFAGEPKYTRYGGWENWENIVSILAFQNGCAVFAGLDRAGELHLTGRFNGSSFASEMTLDFGKWNHLTKIEEDGFYLYGTREDGIVIYESTPPDKQGDPPTDDHIIDWTRVRDWMIEKDFLIAVLDDGSVGFEGARRRAAKRKLSDRWQQVKQVILWSIDGGKSNALAVDEKGFLYSDMTAPGAEDFFSKFSEVRELWVFQPFLLVLHKNTLSFVLFEKRKLERFDVEGVASVMMAEEGKTAVVTFQDGRIHSFGRTLYRSEVDLQSTNVKFYGDRLAYTEDADPFRHFEGIIGIQNDRHVFVLSPDNRRGSEHFISVQNIIFFDSITYGMNIESMGDVLLADGTCLSKRGNFFQKWVGIKQLSSCFTHTVGVTTFNTVVTYGDGEYGSCSVDAYMGVVQAYAMPHATVLRFADGRLLSLCEKLSETPYEPLPVTRDVVAMEKTNSFFALLCKDGSLWACEAQAFADKIRWRGSSEYYTRPWGPWKKLHEDAIRMQATGESIRVIRDDKRYTFMEPTLEKNTLSGQEPTLA